MVLKKISELKEYALNSVLTQITSSQYRRLKEDLTKDGQLDNMLVMDDGTVLGGNKRLKAMIELGWYEARCSEIRFLEDNDGWYANLDGVPQRTRFFKSKEAAMLYYSLKHNDNKYGTYNKEQALLYMDQYEIPYDEIHMSFDEVPSFAQSLNAEVNLDKVMDKLEEKGKEKIKEIDVICPHCGKSFKKEV